MEAAAAAEAAEEAAAVAAATAAVAVGLGKGAALAKTTASGVDSLLRETGWLVTPSRASPFVSLVFLAFPFLYPLTCLRLARHRLKTSLYKKQKTKIKITLW